MVYELSEIKKIRKNLGLTQTDLAKKANVSQSLIAKIESCKIDPTFSKTKKIFNTLDYLQSKEEIKAEELMNRKIISLHPSDAIKDSVAKMKKYGISQMPVLDGQSVIGLVSESTLLNSMIENKGKKISDIMEESPPTVGKNASVKVVSNLLTHYPMVLVSESGKLIGLITKSDFLGKLYKGKF
jgi:predicted transcriptional regulator